MTPPLPLERDDPEFPPDPRLVNWNRWIETIAFLLGVLVGAFVVVVSGLRALGYCLATAGCTEPIDVWPLVIVMVVLVLPKTLGRARAGRVIERLFDVITLRLTGTGAARATITDQQGATVASAKLPATGGTVEMTVPAAPGLKIATDPAAPPGGGERRAGSRVGDDEIASAGKAPLADPEE